jgi:hypothetical protein
MTWIKTNFLWMMFRSKWATSHNQTRILAVWLKREAFERYIANARTTGTVRNFEGTVRLQWDPDHLPNGRPHVYRRAVQLGLRGVSSYADGSDIVQIMDVSEFVRCQAKLACVKRAKRVDDALLVARERVYTPSAANAADVLQLSPPPLNNHDDDDNNDDV